MSVDCSAELSPLTERVASILAAAEIAVRWEDADGVYSILDSGLGSLAGVAHPGLATMPELMASICAFLHSRDLTVTGMENRRILWILAGAVLRTLDAMSGSPSEGVAGQQDKQYCTVDSLSSLAQICTYAGNRARSRVLLDRGLTLALEADDAAGATGVIMDLQGIALEQGDLERAISLERKIGHVETLVAAERPLGLLLVTVPRPADPLFVVLDREGQNPDGSHWRWHLPSLLSGGEWMPPIQDDLGTDGYHLFTPEGLVSHLGPVIYLTEPGRERLRSADGVVICREARLVCRVETWDENTVALFASDCAERVLTLYPYEDRDILEFSIEMSRQFARGEHDLSGLMCSFSSHVVRDRSLGSEEQDLAEWNTCAFVARAAAASTTSTPRRYQASNYAAAAVYTAARLLGDQAAADQARAAERVWQTERLLAYLFPNESCSKV